MIEYDNVLSHTPAFEECGPTKTNYLTNWLRRIGSRAPTLSPTNLIELWRQRAETTTPALALRSRGTQRRSPFPRDIFQDSGRLTMTSKVFFKMNDQASCFLNARHGSASIVTA